MRMKNELRAVAGAAVVALLVAGCGSNPVPPPVMAHGVAARERLVDPRPYGTADTALGLDLLGAFCRSDPGANVVLSPSSLASGLGMAYLGARGGTARAMAGVLTSRPRVTRRSRPGPGAGSCTCYARARWTITSAGSDRRALPARRMGRAVRSRRDQPRPVHHRRAVGAQVSAERVMPPQVSFDRPYLMVVTDRATGGPVFMARVADPTAR